MFPAPMEIIEKDIELDVAVRTAYNQWTQFEELWARRRDRTVAGHHCGRPWHEPLPESVNVLPAWGTNCHWYPVGRSVRARMP